MLAAEIVGRTSAGVSRGGGAGAGAGAGAGCATGCGCGVGCGALAQPTSRQARTPACFGRERIWPPRRFNGCARRVFRSPSFALAGRERKGEGGFATGTVLGHRYGGFGSPKGIPCDGEFMTEVSSAVPPIHVVQPRSRLWAGRIVSAYLREDRIRRLLPLRRNGSQ